MLTQKGCLLSFAYKHCLKHPSIISPSVVPLSPTPGLTKAGIVPDRISIAWNWKQVLVCRIIQQNGWQGVGQGPDSSLQHVPCTHSIMLFILLVLVLFFEWVRLTGLHCSERKKRSSVSYFIPKFAGLIALLGLGGDYHTFENTDWTFHGFVSNYLIMQEKTTHLYFELSHIVILRPILPIHAERLPSYWAINGTIWEVWE